jgi:type IV fimbrial biogenesis protein FimT
VPASSSTALPRSGTGRGVTLLELLLVLAVIAVAINLTSAPFAARLQDLRSASAMHHLASLLNAARHEALLRQQAVTVCALLPDGRCQRTWLAEHEITVFLDRNENRRLDSGETRLRALRWPLDQGRLLWRASLARTYIEFGPRGETWQNGTLTYCPASRDPRFARALVINHAGRAYLTTDSNNDGIREDRSGRNLRC